MIIKVGEPDFSTFWSWAATSHSEPTLRSARGKLDFDPLSNFRSSNFSSVGLPLININISFILNYQLSRTIWFTSRDPNSASQDISTFSARIPTWIIIYFILFTLKQNAGFRLCHDSECNPIPLSKQEFDRWWLVQILSWSVIDERKVIPPYPHDFIPPPLNFSFMDQNG